MIWFDRHGAPAEWVIPQHATRAWLSPDEHFLFLGEEHFQEGLDARVLEFGYNRWNAIDWLTVKETVTSVYDLELVKRSSNSLLRRVRVRASRHPRIGP